MITRSDINPKWDLRYTLKRAIYLRCDMPCGALRGLYYIAKQKKEITDRSRNVISLYIGLMKSLQSNGEIFTSFLNYSSDYSPSSLWKSLYSPSLMRFIKSCSSEIFDENLMPPSFVCAEPLWLSVPAKGRRL